MITDLMRLALSGTLTLLEIVLGSTTLFFLSLVVAKLPTAQPGTTHGGGLRLAAAMVNTGAASVNRTGHSS